MNTCGNTPADIGLWTIEGTWVNTLGFWIHTPWPNFFRETKRPDKSAYYYM